MTQSALARQVGKSILKADEAPQVVMAATSILRQEQERLQRFMIALPRSRLRTVRIAKVGH